MTPPTGRTRVRNPRSGIVVDIYLPADVGPVAEVFMALGKLGFIRLTADTAHDGDFSPPASIDPEQRGVTIARSELTDNPGACPAQWQGLTTDGEAFYIRYRHGWFTVSVGPTEEAAVVGGEADAPEGGRTLIARSIGDEHDGWMDVETLVRLLTNEPLVTIDGAA